MDQVKKIPTVLVIMDGFGYNPDSFYNAIYHAYTPNIDKWMRTYPNTKLCASGACVGLLNGYIGNSEVGHMTIGCGRIVKQPVTIIHDAIKDETFSSNDVLLESLQRVKKTSNRLHIMGLFSDAGVHSHIDHLFAFLTEAKQAGIKEVYVHAFLDGRDVPPKTAAKYLDAFTSFSLRENVGVLGSLHGRFYAMDRDRNWERTASSYNVLTGQDLSGRDFICAEHKIGCECWKDIVEMNYEGDISDEFVVPVLIDSNSAIKNGDGVIFFNFRPDRARQLTASFVDPHFDSFETEKRALSSFITPVIYAANLKTDAMFKKEPIINTLKDVLYKNNKTTFTIAETEKYAHVTYFFNGGREGVLENEIRVLIPSISVKDYVAHPKMSAEKITQVVVTSLTEDPQDFYIINYANADMVAHSGNLEAAIKAIECLDVQLKKLYEAVVEKMGGVLYVTADHGNAENMFDVGTGQPNTAHTTNPVPFIMIQKGLENSAVDLSISQLSDIAPLILKNIGIIVPVEMKNKEAARS